MLMSKKKGRGRRGRQWLSPKGNLFCSLLVKAGPSSNRSSELSFVVSLALYDLLSHYISPSHLSIKWPNDLLCQGKKIAGILLEQADDMIIIGIGLNVRYGPNDPNLNYEATSLKEEGLAIASDSLIIPIVNAFDYQYSRWIKNGFSDIRLSWLDKVRGLNQPIICRLEKGDEKKGIFIGIDDSGALLLKTDRDRIELIYSGDIFFNS